MKHTFTSAAIMAAVCLYVSVAAAQVQVVDSQNGLLNSSSSYGASGASSYPSGGSAPAPEPSPPAGDIFSQLQSLQEEVQNLRGIVEEQAYELKRLKQQRLDDYVNVDRRLSELAQGRPMSTSSSSSSSSGSASASIAADVAPSDSSSVSPTPSGAVDEVQSYRSAIDLVLKEKNYAKASAAFAQYLADFPRGSYAANSQYWLGEIAVLQGDMQTAKKWFSRILVDFPDHNKVPDATYKLGIVYHKLGDVAKAKQLLQQVATGNTNAARLADSYLKNSLR